MSIADVISWKFKDQEGMSCREIDGTLTIVDFPGGVPSKSDQDAWTTEYDFIMYQRTKIRTIKKSARTEIKKVNKRLDTGDLVMLKLIWPTVDQSKAGNKLNKLVTIGKLMVAAIKLVKKATTVSEVDAVSMPVWP